MPSTPSSPSSSEDERCREHDGGRAGQPTTIRKVGSGGMTSGPSSPPVHDLWALRHPDDGRSHGRSRRDTVDWPFEFGLLVNRHLAPAMSRVADMGCPDGVVDHGRLRLRCTYRPLFASTRRTLLGRSLPVSPSRSPRGSAEPVGGLVGATCSHCWGWSPPLPLRLGGRGRKAGHRPAVSPGRAAFLAAGRLVGARCAALVVRRGGSCGGSSGGGGTGRASRAGRVGCGE